MGCKPSKSTYIQQAPFEPKGVQNKNDSPVSNRKRRAGVSAQAITSTEIKNWTQPVYPKSDENRDMLRRIVSTNAKLQVLFGHLSKSELDNVILAMYPRLVAAGERIIRQDENGDAFWIVEAGHFDVYVNRSSEPVFDSDSLGDKVSSCEAGGCFGELALMYNAPRAATVIATTGSKIWGIDAVTFKMMLVTSENTKKKKYESFLEKVSILSELNAYERASLAEVIDVATFLPGETIMKQGDQGNNFYILESGDAKATLSPEGVSEVVVKHYTEPGEYFGELALILASPRKATVSAGDQGCVLLYVCKDKFDRVLGPIKHRLKVEKYPEYADIIEAAKAAKDDPVGEDEES